MAIPTAPTLPARSQAQAAYIANMDAFLAYVGTFGPAANALAASITAGASAASSIPYTFDTTTTDAAPGNGFFRLDNATQSSATTIRTGLIGADTVDYTNVLNLFSSSTSTIKGQIRITKVGDSTKFLIFNVTGLASPSGYRNVPVAFVSGSSASPFANADSVTLVFTRTGDLGQVGPNGFNAPYLKVADQKSSGTSGGIAVQADITQTRTLNTVVTNTITGASLASNIITLAAGTYQIRGRVPGSNVANSQAFLYNATDSTYALIGACHYISGNVDTDFVFSGQITIAAAKNFTVRHFTGGSIGTLGMAASSGQGEIYTEVEIWKVA